MLLVPGLAEIMEGERCVTSELRAFGVFLLSCKAANVEEKPGLDDELSCSRYITGLMLLCPSELPTCSLNPWCLG